MITVRGRRRMDGTAHSRYRTGLMAELPTGTVTFLFTDIEGSTRLLRRLGEAYAPLQDEHASIMRDAIAHGKRRGDPHGG